MRKVIFFLLSALYFYGCIEKNTLPEVMEMINVPELIENSFENNVTEYGYLPLETSLESLISNIEKIRIFKDRIYILDTQGNGKLLIFDINGKFLGCIGKFGRGPEEYARLYNFEIDYNRQELLLLDSGNDKILIFDFNAKFKESISLETKPSNIARLKNGSFIMTHNISRLYSNDNYIVAICSPEGTVLSRHLKSEVGLPFGVANINGLLSLPDGTMSFIAQFHNIVFSISQDNEIIPMWGINFSTNVIDLYDIEKANLEEPVQFFNLVDQKNYIIGNYGGNHQYLCIMNKSIISTEHIIYDKINKKVKRIKNPLWGAAYDIDEDGVFWSCVSTVLLRFMETHEEFSEKLKLLIDNDDNFPLIYFKIKEL